MLAFFLSPQNTLAVAGWNSADNATKADVEKNFKCCGFHNTTDSGTGCAEEFRDRPTCESALENMINYGFRVSGGIGLFFSFTEVF
jgi:tetraspanin-13/31